MKYKVCVVGGGYWGKNHISTLNKLGSLYGIVESDLKLLDYYSKKYPKVNTYTDLDGALKNNFIDGFTVATPAHTHYEITKKILLKNKHVLVEKPIVLNVKEAQELRELANDRNINLMVGHVLLFHPAINKIKQLINKGELGKLQYIYSNRLNLGQVRTEENVFWSLAPHDISIFQYLTDSFPLKIDCKGSTFLQSGIPDSTITNFKYPNSIEGHIFVSWLHPFKEHRLVVIGSESMITFEDSSEKKPLKLYSKKINMDQGVPEKIDGPVKEIKYDSKMPLTEELKYFINHLNGVKLDLANANHALEVTKILVQASKQLG